VCVGGGGGGGEGVLFWGFEGWSPAEGPQMRRETLLDWVPAAIKDPKFYSLKHVMEILTAEEEEPTLTRDSGVWCLFFLGGGGAGKFVPRAGGGGGGGQPLRFGAL
jgi:hypothetical protein